MVSTSMAIEKEVDDSRNIRDAGVVKDKRKESQPSSFDPGKKLKTSTPQGFQGQGRGYKGQGQVKAPSQPEPMTCFYCHQSGHMKWNCP